MQLWIDGDGGGQRPAAEARRTEYADAMSFVADDRHAESGRGGLDVDLAVGCQCTRGGNADFPLAQTFWFGFPAGGVGK